MGASIRVLFFWMILLYGLHTAQAQLSKVHYIPPIAAHGASNSNAFPRDQYIYISTPATQDVNYVIAPMGAAPEDYISGTVSNSGPQRYDIGSGESAFVVVDTATDAGVVVDDRGYVITADAPIFVALRLRASTRTGTSFPQAGALVSKGLSALGTSFRTGTFTSESPGVNNDSANYLNFVSVMATEDNTQVIFDHLDKDIELINIVEPGGVGTFSLTINLNAGESYLLVAEAEDAVDNRDGLIGVSVTSDLPVVVNSGSANGSFHNGGGRDYGIDQIVGADKIGNEYIFVKGNGSDGWENILIVAHEDDTDIFVDGGVVPIANLANAGDYYLIEGNAFAAAGSNRTLYVNTSKNVFAWQGTGTGSEANQGLFFVPPLSCQSQGEVNNIPQIDYIGSSYFSGFVTIVTNQTASVTFSDANNTDKSVEDATFSGGVSVVGPEAVEGTDYKAYILANLSGNVSINSTDELYCSYYNQNGAATSGGFYSGFISQPETVIVAPNIDGEKCLPNVELFASGIEVYDSFKWLFDDGGGYVDLANNSNPYTPLIPGSYKIEAQITCKGVTTTSYSDPVVVSNCPPDFDGDGINDNIDLDLDNDGIFNTYESLGDYQLDLTDFEVPLIIKTATITTAGAYTVTTVVASDSSIVQTGLGEITSSVDAGGPFNQMEWNFDESVNFKLTQTQSITHNYSEGVYFVITTASPTQSLSLWNPDNHLLVDTDYNNSYESGILLFSANEIRFKFNPSYAGPTTFAFFGQNMQNIKITHYNENPITSSVFKFALTLHQNDLDTDGDGTPDAYDLESDGDGCSDVIEAGFSDTDPVPDGILGVSPVTVNTLGQVAFLDGYTQPRDGNLSGVYDFQEVGTPALPANITTQPLSQSLCLGGTAHFEVQSDLDGAVFQWQTHDGTHWVDLSDNGIYSDTQTQNLAVTPVDDLLDGKQYRVLVTKGDYLCDPVPSDAVLLQVVPAKTFSVSPVTLTISETDSPTSIQITLDEAPASNVVLDISNPDITEAIVSPTQLIFTPDNWNLPQAVDLYPQDDGSLDGDQSLFPEVSINRALTQNCYTHAEAKTVTTTVVDGNLVDFEIVLLDNLTDENGGQAFFTVKLLSKPTGLVNLELSSNDATEGELSQNFVLFNPANWNLPQTIIVTGLPDPVPFKDGNIAYQIITGNVSSTDVNYNALDGTTIPDIDLINQDNSGPGIALNVVGGVAETDENGASFTVEFYLLSQPFGGADVSFALAISGDTDEATLSANSITISNENWNKPFNNQITVSGLDDTLLDGDIFLVLETGDPSSADAVYDALSEFDVADLIFRNLDNDNPGYSVGPVSNNLTEFENLAHFDVVLDIRPNGSVYLDVASIDSGEVAVENEFRQLHFTPLNWNIPQTVIVKGVDDWLVDGDQLTQIIVSVASNTHPDFLSEPPQAVDVINEDNDNAEIVITPLDLLTGEDGDRGRFSVILSAVPTHDVQIVWESTNTLEGTVSPTMIFTPDHWNLPQIITVYGVDDIIPTTDGAIGYQIFAASISSLDPFFNSILPAEIPPLQFTNQDNDFAGVHIELIDDDFQTDEDGDWVQVAFSLISKPADDASVIIPLTLQGNEDEMVLLETEIIIQNANWDNPLSNIVTLTGVDDLLLDGDQPVRLITGDPQSVDLIYDALSASAVADIDLVNLDNEIPGIVLGGEVEPIGSTSSGTVTATYQLTKPLNETGETAIVKIKLNAPTTTEVYISIIIPDPTEVGIDRVNLTFTPENWDQEQVITLIGMDDLLLDGDMAIKIYFSVDPITQDDNYSQAQFVTLNLINQDNEADVDEDGLFGEQDNCEEVYNPEQEDWDGDGIGDLCDPDIDGDGVANTQEDLDNTNPYDNCDFFESSISLPVTLPMDCDHDGIYSDVDLDDDNDGILDILETETDNDRDGKVNSVDLDSDGDGCFDVVEAGFEDPDQDGILGSSPVEVDALGRVISAQGYTPPDDRDNSGSFDFLELPQNPTITQQPPALVVLLRDQDVQLNLGVAPEELTFVQWQILEDENQGVWKDLAESDSFKGVQTSQLLLIKPQDHWIDWKFRAAIGSIAYPCGPLIYSDETQFDHRPLEIPNAFSPDSDGVNEKWIIEGLGRFPNHQLTIYSRWEAVILKEAPYQNDWGGELRGYSDSLGGQVPEGTYFYVLDLGNGQPPLKGFIYLKR